ncbi:MAG: beta-ketoacyl-ACP synthase III, partial [Mesorhizobium sp.]
MHRVIISGIGVEIPEPSITNEELVDSFNAWVDMENVRREASGETLLQKSDSAFI